MAVRIKWDQYETALLIDTFWMIEKNPENKGAYIKDLSEKLRRKAINAGIEIDDVFRNTNGITMQLTPIAHAFFPDRPTLTTSAMFEKMVALYLEDRTAFDAVLEEAKRLVDNEVASYAQTYQSIEVDIAEDEVGPSHAESISRDMTVQPHYKREDKEKFYRWLVDIKGVTEATSKGYVSAIKKTEEFAQTSLSSSCKLFSASRDVVRDTAIRLFESEEFKSLNEEKHNRYAVSLRQYLEYMNVDLNCVSSKPESPSSMQTALPIISDELDVKAISEVLQNHYPYGFNCSSPIELLRFRNHYLSDHDKECSYSDDYLTETIRHIGFCFDGKTYIISPQTISGIKSLLSPFIDNGHRIFYYSLIYEKNEQWLFEEKIVSVEMLKALLEEVYPEYQHRSNYFISRSVRYSENDALTADLTHIWGEAGLRTVDDLSSELEYVPADKIKHALSVGDMFVWNSVGEYILRDKILITKDQCELIINAAIDMCDRNGSVSIDELPITGLIEDNYDLSDSALLDVVSSILSNDFSRNGKVFTAKGDEIDTTTAIIKYCKSRESCTKTELEQVMQDVAGELRYPVVVEAANSAMIRIDYDTYVADSRVSFDVDAIDNALTGIVKGNVIGMKEITAMGSLPYCGYGWNWFLLESFCRRFSRKFRYECATPNSKNAGAVVRRDFVADYHRILVEAVAQSGIKLEENEILEYFVSSGLMVRRQYKEMQRLIEDAAKLREGRN